MKYLILLSLISLVHGGVVKDSVHNLCFTEFQTEFTNFHNRQAKHNDQCNTDYESEISELQSYYRNTRNVMSSNILNLTGALQNCTKLNDTIAFFECLYDQVSYNHVNV